MVLKVRNDNTVKARLTARGFLQRAHIDFFETYAPVATPMSIRTVVALAASFGVPLHTADAESAHLQAPIEEDLYIGLPKDLDIGADAPPGTNCFKLLTGLYGTKKAGRGWYLHLKEALLDCGLEESPEDPCLYFWKDCSNNVILAICTVVDDMLGTAKDSVWSDLMSALAKRSIKLDQGFIGHAREFNGPASRYR